jgi:hypothetical protein
MLIIIGFELALDHVSKPANSQFWLIFVPYLATAALFSVTCHRLVLMDPRNISSKPVLRFKGRELRFLYWIITLGMITLVIAMPGVLLALVLLHYLYGNVTGAGSMFATVLAAVPAVYVLSRLSVIFPAIATDQPFSLRGAWEMTAINGWRMMVITAGLPVLIAVLLGLFYREEATLAESVFLSLVGTILSAIEVVALSLAYQDLIKFRGSDAQPAG